MLALIYYMIFELMILLETWKLYTIVRDSEFTQVTAVTIIIYMARKVHTAYMFLECFEACQVKSSPFLFKLTQNNYN